MPLDLTFAEQNRLSLERIKSLVASLTDEELLTPVGNTGPSRLRWRTWSSGTAA